jgi:hypothetical protein
MSKLTNESEAVMMINMKKITESLAKLIELNDRLAEEEDTAFGEIWLEGMISLEQNIGFLFTGVIPLREEVIKKISDGTGDYAKIEKKLTELNLRDYK